MFVERKADVGALASHGWTSSWASGWLVKYPGLTLVGGLAIAFAIWVGASTFELLTQVVRPTLPPPNGDRIVGISN